MEDRDDDDTAVEQEPHVDVRLHIGDAGKLGVIAKLLQRAILKKRSLLHVP